MGSALFLRGSAGRSTKEVYENTHPLHFQDTVPAFVVWHPDAEWEANGLAGPGEQTGVAYV